MQIIPTTATAVEKIKSSAKALKKAEKLPHMEALERAATIAGYDSWYHVGYCRAHQDDSATHIAVAIGNAIVADLKKHMAYLSSKAEATVPTQPTKRIKSTVFCDVEIGDMRLQGFVGYNGPCVTNISPITQESETYVQLGCAEIHHCSSRQPGSNAGWWICKYGADEPRINIDSLTETGRHALAFEFGIPIYPRTAAGSKEEADIHMQLRNKMQAIFYLSPSFRSLCIWAQSHTRKFRAKDVHETYLKGWKDIVIKGESPNASRLVNELLKDISIDKKSSAL